MLGACNIGNQFIAHGDILDPCRELWDGASIRTHLSVSGAEFKVGVGRN